LSKVVPVVAPLAVVLVVAVVLVQLGVLGSGGPAPSPSGAASAETPAPTAFDPTHIDSSGASYSITYEEGAIVVRETDAGGTRVLVTQPAPAGAFATPPTTTGVSFSALACGTPGGSDQREMLFGWTVNEFSSGAYRYSGPAADGGVAENGLFLFVLRSVADDGERGVLVKDGSTSFDPSTPVLEGTFHVAPGGASGVEIQPSGCRLG
jgi:hypothetical protein